MSSLPPWAQRGGDLLWIRSRLCMHDAAPRRARRRETRAGEVDVLDRQRGRCGPARRCPRPVGAAERLLPLLVAQRDALEAPAGALGEIEEVSEPQPHPTSRTRSPGWMSSSRRTQSYFRSCAVSRLSADRGRCPSRRPGGCRGPWRISPGRSGNERRPPRRSCSRCSSGVRTAASRSARRARGDQGGPPRPPRAAICASTKAMTSPTVLMCASIARRREIGRHVIWNRLLERDIDLDEAFGSESHRRGRPGKRQVRSHGIDAHPTPLCNDGADLSGDPRSPRPPPAAASEAPPRSCRALQSRVRRARPSARQRDRCSCQRRSRP